MEFQNVPNMSNQHKPTMFGKKVGLPKIAPSDVPNWIQLTSVVALHMASSLDPSEAIASGSRSWSVDADVVAVRLACGQQDLHVT